METFCGIGLPELLILALIGFVVIGPERSREVALQSGRFLRQMMTSAWWKDVSQMAQAVRDLPSTLVKMAEIEEAQQELRQTQAEIQGVIQDINRTEETVPPGRKRAQAGRRQPEAADNVVTDPWGIVNASSQTSFNPSEPPAGTQSDQPAPQNPPENP